MTQNQDASKSITLKKSSIIAISIISLLLIAFSAFIGYSLNNSKSGKNNNEATSNVQKTETKEMDKKMEVAVNSPKNTPSQTNPVITEQKKADDTKMIKTAEEVKVDQKKVEEKKTESYTNQYFPTLNLPYTSDWSFSTSTIDSNYPGLLQRNISFTKKDLKVSVKIAPYIQPQCGGYGGEIVSDDTKLNNQLYKTVFKTGDIFADKTNNPKYVRYSSYKGNYICPIDGFMSSNIDINNAPKEYKDYILLAPQSYNENVKDISKVNYYYSIFAQSFNELDSNNYITNDNPNIGDVDNLIKRFQF